MSNNKIVSSEQKKDIKVNKEIKIELLILVIYLIGYFNYRDESKCIIFMNKEVCIYDIMLAATLGVYFIGYLIGLSKHKGDPLRKKIGICPDCDYWSVLHATLYFTLGCIFPGRYLMIFILSVCWEIFESYSGTHDMTLFGYCINVDTDGNRGEFWYGRVLDIAVNLFGYILGTYKATGQLTLSRLREEFTL